MLRTRQSQQQRKASRKAISQNASGIFGLIRLLNRFQLLFTLFALALSVILLFIGTYVYFDSNQINANNVSQLNPIYEHILTFYGINETDFTMLYPQSRNSNMNETQLRYCKYTIWIITLSPHLGTIEYLKPKRFLKSSSVAILEI